MISSRISMSSLFQWQKKYGKKNRKIPGPKHRRSGRINESSIVQVQSIPTELFSGLLIHIKTYVIIIAIMHPATTQNILS